MKGPCLRRDCVSELIRQGDNYVDESRVEVGSPDCTCLLFLSGKRLVIIITRDNEQKEEKAELDRRGGVKRTNEGLRNYILCYLESESG